MVAAIGLLVPASFGSTITAFGVTLSTATGLTLAGQLVNVAGSLLLSSAVSALARPDLPAAAKPENAQLNNKSAIAARMGHFGLVKVGGNVVFHRARDGFSYRVIVHGHGKVLRVVQHYLNQEPVDLNQTGFVLDEQYQLDRSRVQIIGRRGVIPETHYSQITSVWPEWTSNHRLDGLWSSLIVCEAVPSDAYRGMYPNNEPELVVLAESREVYDPRTQSVAFSENLALAVASYVASADGFNRPAAFDDADIAAQADICDREVALAGGGTEKLYRVSGSYLLNERPQDVLGRLLLAGAARILLKPTGKLALKVGSWVAPDVTLRYRDIIEVEEANSGPDILDRYNQLPARFNSHALGHVEVDAEPWLDLDRVAEDGEVLTGPDKNLLMCPSHRQARQVMSILMERDNPRKQLTLVCKPRALEAIYGDTVRLDAPEIGLTGFFEIASHDLTFEGGNLKMVTLKVRSVDPGAFTLSLQDQGTVQALPEPDSSSGVPLPQNLTAAAAGIQTAANTYAAAIGVGWQAPPSDALTPVLQVARTGSTDWIDVPVGSGATSVVVPGLIDGQGYDISLAFETPGGLIGDDVVVENVVARAVSGAPAAPTGLTVTDQGNGTALVALVASTSNSLWKTEVYRDGVLVATIYAGPGSEIAVLDASGAGEFEWLARSINVSNTPSQTDAGPITATIA